MKSQLNWLTTNILQVFFVANRAFFTAYLKYSEPTVINHKATILPTR